MPYFFLITLKLLSSRVFGGQIHCHVLVLPLIELKSHIRSIDPCETDNSWVSSHESEVDVIVYIVYAAVLLNSSVLNCTEVY